MKMQAKFQRINMRKVHFFCFLGEANEFVEVGHKMSYYTIYNKICFSKNLHIIWPGEQFKVGPFFLKYPVYTLSWNYNILPQNY